jgi:hypothetical protein
MVVPSCGTVTLIRVLSDAAGDGLADADADSDADAVAEADGVGEGDAVWSAGKLDAPAGGSGRVEPGAGAAAFSRSEADSTQPSAGGSAPGSAGPSTTASPESVRAEMRRSSLRLSFETVKYTGASDPLAYSPAFG